MITTLVDPCTRGARVVELNDGSTLPEGHLWKQKISGTTEAESRDEFWATEYYHQCSKCQAFAKRKRPTLKSLLLFQTRGWNAVIYR